MISQNLEDHPIALTLIGQLLNKGTRVIAFRNHVLYGDVLNLRYGSINGYYNLVYIHKWSTAAASGSYVKTDVLIASDLEKIELEKVDSKTFKLHIPF